MTTLILRLDPRMLDNPDADIRYQLPDLLAERSEGIVKDDGYDYVGDGSLLLLFLKTSDVGRAIACVLEVVQNVRVLGNDLRPAAVIAIEREEEYEVVYPSGFEGSFLSM